MLYPGGAKETGLFFCPIPELAHREEVLIMKFSLGQPWSAALVPQSTSVQAAGATCAPVGCLGQTRPVGQADLASVPANFGGKRSGTKYFAGHQARGKLSAMTHIVITGQLSRRPKAQFGDELFEVPPG